MEKFVVYTRVSTDKQGAEGYGMEAQHRDINLYLENYAPEYEILGEFTDVVSAKDMERPGMQQAHALLKAHPDATLLVSKLDRLSRDVEHVAGFIKRFNLRVAAMPHADKFQLHIYAALAEQEREFISLRTKAGLKSAKARGVKLGGLRPGTEARNKGRQDAAQRRAEKHSKLLTSLVAQNMSIRDIGNVMTEATGDAWGPSKVHRTLKRLEVAA
jgi:DNA invertase Pin-like site-specific DNA recombinase